MRHIYVDGTFNLDPRSRPKVAGTSSREEALAHVDNLDDAINNTEIPERQARAPGIKFAQVQGQVG